MVGGKNWITSSFLSVATKMKQKKLVALMFAVMALGLLLIRLAS